MLANHTQNAVVIIVGCFVYGDTDWFIWHVWLLGQQSSNQI